MTIPFIMADHWRVHIYTIGQTTFLRRFGKTRLRTFSMSLDTRRTVGLRWAGRGLAAPPDIFAETVNCGSPFGPHVVLSSILARSIVVGPPKPFWPTGGPRGQKTPRDQKLMTYIAPPHLHAVHRKMRLSYQADHSFQARACRADFLKRILRAIQKALPCG